MMTRHGIKKLPKMPTPEQWFHFPHFFELWGYYELKKFPGLTALFLLGVVARWRGGVRFWSGAAPLGFLKRPNIGPKLACTPPNPENF
jgi:hypothetical protein